MGQRSSSNCAVIFPLLSSGGPWALFMGVSRCFQIQVLVEIYQCLISPYKFPKCTPVYCHLLVPPVCSSGQVGLDMILLKLVFLKGSCSLIPSGLLMFIG